MDNRFREGFAYAMPTNLTGNTLPQGIGQTMAMSGTAQEPNGISALQQALLAFGQTVHQPLTNQMPMAPQTGFPDLETAFQRFSQLLNQFRGAVGNRNGLINNSQVGQEFFNNLINAPRVPQPPQQTPTPLQALPSLGQTPKGVGPTKPENPSPSQGKGNGGILKNANIEDQVSKGGDASSIFSGTTMRY